MACELAGKTTYINKLTIKHNFFIICLLISSLLDINYPQAFI